MNVPVVITAADTLAALGAARTLSSRGIECIGVAAKGHWTCARSSAWAHVHSIDSADDYPWFLGDLGANLTDRPVLLHGADAPMLAVSENRTALEKQYRFLLPRHETVELLLDKTRFHEWAINRHFPVPETHIVDSRQQLDSVMADVDYPVVLKPCMHTAEWFQHIDHKALRLNDYEDYRHLSVNLAKLAHRLVVQEWIEGDDSDVYFCLVYYGRDGEELAHFTGRKLTQWPQQTGSTSIAVRHENTKLQQLTREVFEAANYRGLGSVEVKRSANDGNYYITEPTVGRFNKQSEIAILGGVDLPQIAYSDITDTPWEPRTPKASIWVADDNPAAYPYIIRHFPWLKSLTARTKLGCFRFSDPIPWLALIWKTIKMRISRR